MEIRLNIVKINRSMLKINRLSCKFNFSIPKFLKMYIYFNRIMDPNNENYYADEFYLGMEYPYGRRK